MIDRFHPAFRHGTLLVALALLADLLAACDNPIEKNTREQLRAPIAQNTQYAIDDVAKLIKPGIECNWAARDTEALRTNPDDTLVREELGRIKERAKQAGCLED